MGRDFHADLTRLLRDAGCWRVDGGKGSNEKWRSPLNGRTFIVPRSKSRHTANEVLKQAGLPKAFQTEIGGAGRRPTRLGFRSGFKRGRDSRHRRTREAAPLQPIRI